MLAYDNYIYLTRVLHLSEHTVMQSGSAVCNQMLKYDIIAAIGCRAKA